MRSVSMSPDDAQSVIATKRMGEVFDEYKSNSSVMIVLEGQNPLGADAHAYYDQIVKKLDADTKHVEHVQDMWSDPLTGAGAQSNDGKAAYVQVYLAGNQGEALANESVEAVQNIVKSVPTPNGVKAYVTGPAALCSGSAHGRRPQRAGDHHVHVHRDHRDAAVGLPVDHHGAAHAGDGGVRAVGRAWNGRLPRLLQDHRALDVRHEPVGHAGDRGRDRLCDLLDRAISGSPVCRRIPRRRLLHDVRRHRARGARVGLDHCGRDVLPALHQPAVLPDAGYPVGHRHGGRGGGSIDARPRGHLGGDALRPRHSNPGERNVFAAGARSAPSWSGGPAQS